MRLGIEGLIAKINSSELGIKAVKRANCILLFDANALPISHNMSETETMTWFEGAKFVKCNLTPLELDRLKSFLPFSESLES